MSETVLVPYDGSPLSRRALEYALEKCPDDEFVVLTVVDPVDAVYAAELGGLPEAKRWATEAREAAEERLEEAADIAAEAGVDAETVLEVGDPERRIVDYVAAHDVDQIVLGSHGRTGVSRLVLGSVAERVVRHSPVPVTVVR